MLEWAIDLEANTQPLDYMVWAWGAAKICENPENSFLHGETIAELVDFCASTGGRFWFHNLAYDGKFVISHLLETGWVWVHDRPGKGQFFTTIDKMGRFYKIELKGDKSAVFADSMKKIPMSVRAVAATYKLEYSKGELDYDTVREKGHKLTEKELDYLRRDVLIMAHAMHIRLQMGTKLTTGADCLASYKDLVGSYTFMANFPKLNAIVDAAIRRAYRGGFVYVNERYRGKDVGRGMRIDNNSLFPWALYTKELPYGTPVYGKGQYKQDERYPLWVGEITFTAHLKKDGIPTIQMRNSMFYADREYLTDTAEPVTLWVSSVDWELINDMYDVAVYDYIQYYKFKAKTGMFDDYIEIGMDGKIHATTAGERLNFKLWLNNLYGKMGQKRDCTGKKPVLDPEDGIVHYVTGRKEERDPVYIPVAVFVTAYARELTVRTAHKFGDRYIYSDTDSIHFTGTDIPDGVEIHDSKLGAFKIEAEFVRARFIRPKTYAEEVLQEDGTTKCEFVCAGMSDGLKSAMEFEDFREGFTTDVSRGEVKEKYLDTNLWKLKPRSVPHGVILEPVPFTIHATKKKEVS